MLGVSLSLTRAGRMARSGVTPPPPPPPPPGQGGTDPDVLGVLADGWRVTYQSPPGAFDPAGDPKTVAVSRQGFDGQGAAVAVPETLTVMARVREPYPDHATLTAEDAALSDFVYAGDTVDGAANGSARAYPKPVAMWLDHDMRRVTGQSYTARLAVAHAYARAGRPVAAVRFVASDGAATAEVTVPAMSVRTYAASGLSVPHFAGTLDLSGLAADAVITIDAVIYPWVGEAFTVSADADPWPSPNLTVLRVFNDIAYGTAYAYVDAAAGDDGAGAASETAATAEAAPFATIAAAAAAIRALNNASFGRNNASGGVIRLEEGVHTHGSFSSVAVGDLPLEIEAAGAQAATVWQDAGASVSNGLPDRLKVTGVTLRRNAASNVIFLDNAAGAGSANMLALEDCAFDDAGFGPSWGAWAYRTGRLWLIGCSGGRCGQAEVFSSAQKTIVAIGSDGECLGRATYSAAGCRDLASRYRDSAKAELGRPALTGGFVGFCHLGHGTDSERVIELTGTVGPRGFALAGSVIEQYGGTTGPACFLSADGVTLPVENVLRIANTVTGSRTNTLYQDTGSATVTKEGTERFNVDRSRNSKSDVFGQDGALTGNWAQIHRVGARANAALRGGDGGGAPGGGAWIGELAEAGAAYGSAGAPLDPAWADDRSTDGSGTGGGDYTPGPGHGLPAIPAGLAPWSHDQKGRAVADDGTAVAGALQPL